MTRTLTHDAVVAGYLGVDLMPVLREMPSGAFRFVPGGLVEATGLQLSLGGVVANTGLAMRRMGVSVRLMGCVGCDPLGDVAMRLLADHQADGDIRRRPDAGTAYGLVLAPTGMDRMFIEDPGCNRVFTADDVDEAAVANCRLFHFGYPPLMDALWQDGGTELIRLLRRVRETGAVVSLDLSLPDLNAPSGQADWRGILTRALPLVDIFVPSVDELFLMLDPAGHAAHVARAGSDVDADPVPEGICGRLAAEAVAMGAGLVMVKAGARGAHLHTGDLTRLHDALPGTREPGCPDGMALPALPVDPGRVRNASGAGDCAIAGFLAALLKGERIASAGRYAMMAGRDNLYGADALAGIRSWAAMRTDTDERETE